jgi:hypothetical protein
MFWINKAAKDKKDIGDDDVPGDVSNCWEKMA